MKINKIQENKTIYFKQIQTTNKQNKKISLKSDRNFSIPNNPKYYQALNLINFKGNFIVMPRIENKSTESIKLYIPLEDGDKVTFNIDKSDSLDVFLDENGELAYEVLELFAKYYAKFYRIRKGKFEKEKDALLNILNQPSSSNIKIFNPKEELRKALTQQEQTEPELYGEYLLQDISDEKTKKQLAAKRLFQIEEAFAKSSITIAKELICIIKISRLEGSQTIEENLEKKLSIAVPITNYNQEVDGDYTDLILHYSKDETGKIDYDFCSILMDLLLYCTKGKNPEREIIQASNLINFNKTQNPKEYKEIVQDIISQYLFDDIEVF